MNKIFRVIWSHTTQSWVAVSELTKAHGKTKSVTTAVAVTSLAFLGGISEATAALVDNSPTSANSKHIALSTSATGTPNAAKVTDNNHIRPLIAIGSNAQALGTPSAGGSSEGGGGIAIGAESYIFAQEHGRAPIAIGYRASAAFTRPFMKSEYDNGTYLNGHKLQSGGVAIGAYARAGSGLMDSLQYETRFSLGIPTSGQANSGWKAYYYAGMYKKNPTTKLPYTIDEVKALVAAGTQLSTLVETSGQDQTAIGSGARALGDQSTAIGAQSIAGVAAIAIGANDVANANESLDPWLQENIKLTALYNRFTGLGLPGVTDYAPTRATTYSTSIGPKSYADSPMATALGGASRVNTKATFGTAIGAGAQVGNGRVNTYAGIAIGAGAYSEHDFSTAIGSAAKATALKTYAGGYKARASDENAVALGVESVASKVNTVAIGSSSKATTTDAIAIGNGALSKATSTSLTAEQETVKNEIEALATTIAASNNNHGTMRNQVANLRDNTVNLSSDVKGLLTKLHKDLNGGSLATGAYSSGAAARKAVAERLNNIAKTIGDTRTIAIGSSSEANRAKAIAIGTGALASGESSISLGSGNIVSGNYSGAFGDPSIVEGTASYAFGNDNVVGRSTTGAFVLGNNNQMGAKPGHITNTNNVDINAALTNVVDVSGSVAVGSNNSVTSKDTFILGSGINTKADGITPIGNTVENSVYLGKDSTAVEGAAAGTNNVDAAGDRGESTTAGDKGVVNDATVAGISYQGFQGNKADGVVTVGSAGKERRIQNVAAGEISRTSTDAINGSQLYLTHEAITTVNDNIPFSYSVKNANGDDVPVTYIDGNFYKDDEIENLTYDPKEKKFYDSKGAEATPPTPITDKNSINITAAVNNNPDTVTNIKGNLAPTYNKGDQEEDPTNKWLFTNAPAAAPTTNMAGPKNVGDIYNNAATVGDVLNAGWNLQENGGAKDFVKPYDTVNFVDTATVKANVTTADTGLISNVSFSVNTGEAEAQKDGSVANKTPAADITAKEAVIAEKQKELDAEKAKLAQPTTDLETAKTTLAEKQKAFEDAEKQYNDERIAIEAEKEKLATNPNDAAAKARLAAAELLIPQKRAALEAADKALKDAKDDVAAKEKVLAPLNAKVAEAEAALEKAKVEKAQLENQVATVSNVVKAINESGFNIFQDDTTADNHKALVNPADKVVFRAAGEAHVNVSKEKDGTTNITYRVDMPVIYTDKDGNKLVKGEDGKFYNPTALEDKEYIVGPDGTGKYYPKGSVVSADGKVYPKGTQLQADGNAQPGEAEQAETAPTETPKENVIASMNSLSDDKKATAPMRLANVAGNLPQTVNKGDKKEDGTSKKLGTEVADAPTKSQKLPDNFDVVANYTNAATVGDVLNAGWNLQGNGKAVDFVKPYDTVNFVDGTGTTVVAEASEDGKISTIKINTLTQYTTEDGTPVTVIDGKVYPAGSIKGPDDKVYPAGTQFDNQGAPLNGAQEVAELNETPKISLVDVNGESKRPTVLGNVAQGTKPLDGTNRGDKKTADTPTAIDPARTQLAEAYKGLADLNNSNDNNALTVADAKNLGWVVSSDKTTGDLGTEYADDVRNANEVRFVGTGLATVSGKTGADGVRTITVDVKANESQQPVVYTDKDGNKVIKAADGKFYPADSVVAADGSVYPAGTALDANGMPKDQAATPLADGKDAGDVIASMNNGDDKTTEPMKLVNVAGTLAPTYNLNDPKAKKGGKADKDTPAEAGDITKQMVNPFDKDSTTPATAEELASVYNNAATVGDVLNAGWNLQENSEARDFVKPYDTVNFVNGQGTTVKIDTSDDGRVSNVRIDTLATLVDKDGNPLIQIGDQFYKAEDIDPKTGQPKVDNGNVAQPANGPFNVNISNPTAKDAETTTPIQVGNVAAGANTYAADKGSDEKTPLVKVGENYYTPDDFENGKLKPTATPADYDAATALNNPAATAREGLADLNHSNPTNVMTVADAKNLGWVVSSDKKTTQLDQPYADDVRNADEVRFVGTGLATVSGATEDNVRIITVDVKAQQQPVVYTDAAGNKLIKGDDGKFYPADSVNIGGKYYPAGTTADNVATATPATATEPKDVIASMNDGGDSTTAPMKLANVKGNLPQTVNTGDKKEAADDSRTLDKAPDALADAPTRRQEAPTNVADIYNNAATVGDVLNAGWNLSVNGDSQVDFVKPYDTVNFNNGKGTLASVENKDGKVSNVTFNIDNGEAKALENGALQGTSPEDKADLEKAVKDAEAEVVKADEAVKAKETELADAQKALAAAPDDQAAKDKVAEAEKALADAQAEKANKDSLKAKADRDLVAVDNKVATVENVVNAVNKSGFKLKASESKDGGSLDQTGTADKDLADDAAADAKAKATKGELINPGDTVEMVAGKNLVVKHDEEGKITYSLAKDINVNSVTVETTGPKGEKGSPITMVSSPDNTLSLVAPQKDENGNVTGVAPVTVNGIKGNLAPTYNAGDFKDKDGKLLNEKADKPTPSQVGPDADKVAGMYNNAATVGDVLNAGWNLKENGGERDFVKPYDTVEFINGAGTTVTVKTADDGKSSTVKVDVNTANISPESPSSADEGKVIAAPKELVEKLAEAEKAVADAKKELADAEKALADNKDQDKVAELTKAVEDAKAKANNPDLAKAVEDAKKAIENDNSGNGLATAKNVADAINASGWKATSAADGGTVSGTTEELINPGETVTFKAGKNIDLKQDGNNFTYSLAENINVNSVTVETADPTDPTKKGSPITMVSSPDNTLSLVAPQKDEQGNVTGVAPVTVNGIKGNLDPTYNAGDFKDKDGKLLNEKADKPTPSQVGPDADKVAGMYNNAATVGDVLNAGWNLKENGGERDFVKPYDTVEFINGTGTTVTVETAKDGKSSTVKVDVNKGEITPNDDGSVTGPTPKELVEKLAEAEKAVADAEKAVADAEKALADNKEPEKVDELTQAVEAAKQKAADPELAKAVAEAKDAIAKDPSSNQVATAKNVADAINASGWTATSAEDGGKTTGTTKELINPGETVTFKSGTNIELKQDGNNFTYSLAENIKVNSVTVETADPTDPTKKGAPISMVSVPEEENTLAFVAPKKGEDGKIVAAPVTIQNINGSLPVTYNQGDNEIVNGKPTGNKVDAKDVNDVQEAPSADEIKKIYNNAATVGDVLNAGWNLKENGNARDFVKPYDTVEFINGAGTTVTVETAKDGKSSTVKVDVNTANISLDSSSNEGKVIAAPKELVEKLAEAEKALADAEKAVAEAEKALAENKDPAKEAELKQAVEDAKAKAEDPKLAEDIAKAKENIAKDPSGNGLVTAKNVADAINSSGWKVTSAANGGTVSGTTEEIINPGETVTLKAGKNIELKQEGNDFTYSLAENIKVNSVTVETADPTDPTKKGSPISMVSVPDAENTLAFVAPKTDANGNVVAAPVTIQNIAGNLQGAKKDGNSFDVAPKNARTEPENAAAIYNNAATVGDVLNAGWNLQNNGEARDFVKPYDAVNFVDGEGTTATVITSPDGKSSDIVYSVNVDGKTTEITYTNAAGETIYKLADGTYNTQRDGKGETVAPEMITGSRVSAILPTTSVGGKQVGGNINFGDSETASVSTNEAGDIVVNVNTGDITANEDEGSVAGPQVAAQKVLDEAKKKLAELPETATPEEKKAAEDAVVAAQKALNNAPNQVATAQNVADAISKSGFTLTAQGQNRSVVNPGETVDMRNTDGNIVISKSADNNDVVYNLARDINVDSVQFGEDGPKVQKGADGSIKVGDKDNAPVAITNVAGNLPGAKKDGNSFDVAPKNARTEPENVAAIYNNAATVGDVLNAGWNLQNNGEAKDFVKPYDTVNFVDGQGTTATVTTDADGKVSNITYNVNVDGKTTEITYTNAAGDTIYKLADGTYNTQRNGKGQAVDASTITGNRVSAILPTTSVGGNEVGGNVNFNDSATTEVKAENGNITVNVKTADINATPNGNVEGPAQALINKVKDAEQAVADANQAVADAQKALNENKDLSKAVELQQALDAAKAKAADPALAQAVAKAKEDLAKAPEANKVATAQNVAEAINASGWKATSAADGGTVSGTTEELINPSETVTFKAGKNIELKQNGNSFTYGLADNIEFNSVNVQEVNAGKVTADEVKVGDVVINNAGINAGNKVISNVAQGKKGTDAVNVDQLNGAVNNINKTINRNNKQLRAGIAGANAAAGLPQVYIPGKSMVAASAGTYKGQSAVAVGYSRASDNGKLIFKVQGNANTRGDFGGSVGVGYQW